MRYVFFTADGHGLPIAYKLLQEGQEVYVGIVQDTARVNGKKETDEKRKSRTSLFKGMFPKIYNADTLLNALLKVKRTEDYFVFCDFNNLYRYATPLRNNGFRGLLPHKSDYELEEDRQKAKQFVERTYPQLKVAQHKTFFKVQDALDFLQENEDTNYVLKPFSEAAPPTLNPREDNAELNHQQISENLSKFTSDYESKGFLLEEKIMDIVEFIPQAEAFNGTVLGVTLNIETKYLGAGDTGWQVGCGMSLVEWLDKDSDVYERFLKPAESIMLRKNEYTVWDAGVAYSPKKDDFYFLEYCSDRVGYNAIFDEISTFPSVSQFFERIVSGEPLFSPLVKRMGASVRLFNLPQSGTAEIPTGLTIEVDDDVEKNVWLWDVRADEEGKRVTAGFDKNLVVVTGQGENIDEAVNGVYNNVKGVHVKDEFHRPMHDYMSWEYPTSIPNRYSRFKELFGGSQNRIPDVSATSKGRH